MLLLWPGALRLDFERWDLGGRHDEPPPHGSFLRHQLPVNIHLALTSSASDFYGLAVFFETAFILVPLPTTEVEPL